MGRTAVALFKSSVGPAALLPNYSPFTPPKIKSLRPIAKRTVKMSSSDIPNGPPPSTSTSTSASAAVDFLTLCHRLKTTKRAGWVRRGVSDPESIADHMYRMGVMALVAPDVPGADRDRLVKMAIVHDIAEAVVGDITPADGVPKEEKSRREREAIDHMCNLLGGGSRAKEIEELWTEYEENSSLEAKVVKDFDKVQIFSQGPSALRLEREEASLESWPLIKKKWNQTSCIPDGIILVEELIDNEEEDTANDNNGNGSESQTWGLVVQGQGMECAAPCYTPSEQLFR